MSYKTFLLASFFTASTGLTLSVPVYAQEVETLNGEPEALVIRRVVRPVGPENYWVDADKLSVRNNPVAGDVTGVIPLGRKVKAYDRFENWIRISPEGKTQSWVNVNYLTTEEVSWANYNFNSSRARSRSSRNISVFDVDLRKIDIEDDSKARVFAARITELPNRNRTIVTKQIFREGSYFEKRMVSCSEDSEATGHAFIGEGHSYLMAERDVRGKNFDTVTLKAITPDTSLFQSSVAAFACMNLPN